MLALPGDLGHLLGQRVGDRLGDERLAAARRPVEQDPLRGGQLVLDEQLPVQERQLDGVGDRLDLAVEAADVGVGDVGHLLEDQLLDLGAGQLLEQQLRAGLHQHGVAGAQLHAEEAVGQLDHPLLVGPADDDGPPAVLEHLLEGDDLAGVLALAGQDHVERLVEHDLLAAAQLGRRRCSGWSATRILRPPEKTSTVPSSLACEEGPVGARRLGELVDLLAQGGDVLLGLLQGEGQLLVLRDGLVPAGPWSRAAAPRATGPVRGPPTGAGGGCRPLPPRDADRSLQPVELLAQRQLTLLLGFGRRNHLLGMFAAPRATLHRPEPAWRSGIPHFGAAPVSGCRRPAGTDRRDSGAMGGRTW